VSGRAAPLGLLLAALTACGSSARPRPTRVDREQRVVADTEARTRWFATLYSLQRQLATADARRLEVLGPLQVMLCLSTETSLARLGEVAQARMALTGPPRSRTRVRRTLESEQALTRWIESAPRATGPEAEREALAAVEQTLVVERSTPSGMVSLPMSVTAPEPRCEPGATEGTQGAPGPAIVAQLAVTLRRSAAQGLIFERSVALAGELRGLLPSVSAGAPPALAAELRAADRALVGILARATMFLHESARTEQWALALLIPEGQALPEEVPDVTPEDNDPRNNVP
jgi:hypothetical protein